MKKVLYIALGFVLAMAVFITAERGLREADHTAYLAALALQPAAARLGFEDFQLEDYPVSFYNGRNEAVIQGADTYTRSPILGVLAATTWKVDDHYEIFMPTFEDMRRIYQATPGGTENGAYGTEEHAAVLWHEAFHAWHFATSEQQLDALSRPPGLQEAEPFLSMHMDDDPTRRAQVTEEMRLLLAAYRAETPAEQEARLKLYATQREERLAELPEDVRRYEDFYELAEGGAYYVEAAIFLEQYDDTMYNERYLMPAGAYARGNYKYYRSGFLKYLLLDARDPGWKADFGRIQNITTQLMNTVGGDG